MSSPLLGHDVRNFTMRQLAREFESGATLADAASRLRLALPVNDHWSVDEAESLFAGRQPAHAQSQLGAVLGISAELGIKRESAFTAYQACARDSRSLLADALAGARTFGVYLASMVVVLAIVVSVYALFVMPQFEAMFDQFGTPLPAFTRALIGQLWLLFPALVLLLAALVFYFFGLARIRGRLLGLEPLLPVLRWAPGFRRWATRYDAGLWMRYHAIFLDAGANADTARAAAGRLVSEPEADQRRQLLASATLLGRLREELVEQISRSDREALEQFERPRNALILLIRGFIYLLIGSYVMAMYLPIFKLGSII